VEVNCENLGLGGTYPDAAFGTHAQLRVSPLSQPRTAALSENLPYS
jgi:hypothetical protein